MHAKITIRVIFILYAKFKHFEIFYYLFHIQYKTATII